MNKANTPIKSQAKKLIKTTKEQPTKLTKYDELIKTKAENYRQKEFYTHNEDDKNHSLNVSIFNTTVRVLLENFYVNSG